MDSFEGKLYRDQNLLTDQAMGWIKESTGGEAPFWVGAISVPVGVLSGTSNGGPVWLQTNNGFEITIRIKPESIVAEPEGDRESASFFTDGPALS